jgi:hypothetical protein
MQRRYFLQTMLFLASLLMGCAPNAIVKSPEDYRMPTDVPSAAELTATVEAEIQQRTPPADCPVTTAEDVSFRAPEPYSPVAPWEGLFWYGTEGLWTTLSTDGVWSRLSETSDGYINKIVWWSKLYSLKDEPEPALIVSGQRLDAKSEPLRFYGATNIIEEEAGEAMLTGVEFPTLGCWEVRAEYKNSDLTFVVWVAP